MELVYVGQSVKMNVDGHSETYRKLVPRLLKYDLEILQGLSCLDFHYYSFLWVWILVCHPEEEENITIGLEDIRLKLRASK